MLDITQTDIDPEGRIPHYVQIKFDDDGHADAEALVNDYIKSGYVPTAGRIRPNVTNDGYALIGKVHGRKPNLHLIYVIILIYIK